MLHTVHMFCKLDYHLYSALFKVLQQMSRQQQERFYKEQDDSYHCELLKDSGLILILRHVELNESVSYRALEIIMNPMRVLNGNDYYRLANEKHSREIYTSFKRALKPIKECFERIRCNKHLKFKLHLLDLYSYKRVDFAVNICTEQIKLYMELIKRANIPDGFQQYLLFDKTSKRYKPPENSFYIFKKAKSKSRNGQVALTINCYDKGVQMQENNLPCEEQSAGHTIRFEVQCHYGKVYRTIQAKGLNKQGFAQFLKDDISEETLHTYFKKTVGYGDYYTLSKATEIIRKKLMNPDKKEALIKILELVNTKRGIWKAKEYAVDKKEFEKRIKQLHELGVNPVTIPVSWGIEYLPGLFSI